jgi:hypothetical protein
MAATISLEMFLVWFVWGFFMGLGWTLASWLLNRLLAKV